MNLTGPIARNLMLALLTARIEEHEEVRNKSILPEFNNFMSCYPLATTLEIALNEDNTVKIDDLMKFDSWIFNRFIEDCRSKNFSYKMKKLMNSVVYGSNAKRWKDLPEYIEVKFIVEYQFKRQVQLLKKFLKSSTTRIIDMNANRRTFNWVPTFQTFDDETKDPCKSKNLVCVMKTTKSVVECFIDILEKRLSDVELFKKYGENTIKKIAECYSDPIISEVLKEKLGTLVKNIIDFNSKRVEIIRFYKVKYETLQDQKRNEVFTVFENKSAADYEICKKEIEKVFYKKMDEVLRERNDKLTEIENSSFDIREGILMEIDKLVSGIK